MKRTIFIGQAMPRVKKNPHDWPSLNSWLYSIGVSEGQIKKNFFYSALVDYFPGSKSGSHRVPTEAEIQKERARLAKTIKDFKPQVIVTIGKLSLSHCLLKEIDLLSKFIGKTFKVDPYNITGKKILIIPLPHPSGASTWYRKPGNRKLLNRALKLLKNNLF
jgi:uracil-DNA glycosylase